MDAPTAHVLGRARRYRRPSAEPPPLPRRAGWKRSVALAGIVLAIGVAISVALRLGIAEPFGRSLLVSVQRSTPTWIHGLASRIDALGDVVAVLLLRAGTVFVAAAYRRWRHVVAFLVTVAATDWVVARVLAEERMPPAGIEPGSDLATFWFPSPPVAALTVTLVGMAFVLAPAGRSRRIAIALAIVAAAAYAGARIVLGADYVLDVAYAIAIGATAPPAAFAAFVPDEVFPVRYARAGTAAHLDLGGERGRAIVEAMADQLGFAVTDVKPFGLEGSGGSSPLRMRVRELDGHLFGKIYNTGHLRADRWYRIGRTLLYGKLEDEVRMGSVRRLVEYEDYALRLLADDGIRVAETYGIVELTPNVEYMLVTEFFEDAHTLGDAKVDDAVIDDGLALVKTLWERGLAHRDMKPANLLVKDGRLQLVDVSGLEVRPTSWRQAVDLANMMLTLALRTDPDRVFERATRLFTQDELGEAFAADVGLAIPTQLKAELRADPRPILARFKELAPHPPIAIQRWSARRTALLAVAVLAALVVVSMTIDAFVAGPR